MPGWGRSRIAVAGLGYAVGDGNLFQILPTYCVMVAGKPEAIRVGILTPLES